MGLCARRDRSISIVKKHAIHNFALIRRKLTAIQSTPGPRKWLLLSSPPTLSELHTIVSKFI
jgi:hypothetical protein